MPTLSDTQALAAALAELRLYLQPDIEPKIEAEEVDALLAKAKQASTWVNNTAYVVGDVVLPTVRNGHQYRCIVAGTSEALLANEPEWPTLAGAVFTEGASNPILTWVEDGAESSSIYDVQFAIHQGWMLKAIKASMLYATGEAEMQQVHEHCLKMAEKFGSLRMA